jgi:hypothetical protein
VPPATEFDDPPLDTTEVHADIALIGEVADAPTGQVAGVIAPVDAVPPDT